MIPWDTLTTLKGKELCYMLCLQATSTSRAQIDQNTIVMICDAHACCTVYRLSNGLVPWMLNVLVV